MNNADTVLSYLVPRLTSQVEDAATEALGFILNRSPECRKSLSEILDQATGFDLGPIERVATQVTYKDGSRPDMAGYDGEDLMRLLVESKFWAALRDGQPSYIEQFEHDSSAALLFIAPEARVETLWSEIQRQFGETCMELNPRCESPDLRSAGIVDRGGAKRAVVLTSWRRLLDGLAEAAGGDVA